MKILILTNVVLSIMDSKLFPHKSYSGGWINSFVKSIEGCSDIEIALCFPYKGKPQRGVDKKLYYYTFSRKFNNTTSYSYKIENQMRNIIYDFNPDIVHIFGTEFPHSLAMIKAFNNHSRTIINIQGLCSIIAKHYYAGLPISAIRRNTFRDFITRSNIFNQKKKFEKRGAFEKKAISSVSNIIGRTEWDHACTSLLNENVNYFSINESLRDPFYDSSWDINKCERHSIFMSQGNYPIKGLHFVLEALYILKPKYPEIKLYVAGKNILKSDNLVDRLKRTAYSKYIEKLIKNYDISNNVSFINSLDDYNMKIQYLKSNVFVMASSIENSPNSLAEAMILGVPIVSSDVGGIKSLISDKEEGLLYQYDAPYMLAYYIDRIFNDDNLALSLSVNARKRAKKSYNRNDNTEAIINLYKKIYNSNNLN